MELLGLLAVPLVVAGIAALMFQTTITLKEVFLQFVGVSLLVVAGFFIARHYGMSDTEHWHGRVTDKSSGTQKCCHCRDVCKARDKKGNCTRSEEECSHTRDYWWSLETTLGEISVDSCESSSWPPALWSRAQIGEPATVERSYINYLKADPGSLFVHDIKSPYLAAIPAYPEVYDLYRVNPVISDGPRFPATWQQAFRELNAELGAAEQVDVTVLVTRVQDPTYAQAVEAKWMYGPKNSMTLVLGVQGEQVTWARVVSISRIEELKITLRDGLPGKTLSDDVPGIVRDIVKTKFKRTPMAEFEYLASNARPPTGWIVALYVLGLLMSIGCSAYLHKNDLFGDERLSNRNANPFSRRYFR